ncbi:MAG: hypothetical protein IJQ23_05220 [Clostridia bacterium]|nr:hypothetical protein [Clostridia bacterium]
MVKTTLKRIFAIVGSGLAPIAAILYFILGIQAILGIADDVTANIYYFIMFLLCFALASLLTFFGGKVLFSFLNNENDDEPFSKLALSFVVFEFAINLFEICFHGGNAANWLMLIFSLAGTLTLLARVTGLKTAWYTDVVGVGIAMLTAMTAACASGGVMLAASVIVAMSCFSIMAIFALHLIKDEEPKPDEEKEKSEEK